MLNDARPDVAVDPDTFAVTIDGDLVTADPADVAAHGPAVLPVLMTHRTSFALMLLADGRLPAGGHVHSGGIESAVADGRVHDLASLRSFTEGRLWTAGLTDAALVRRHGRAPDGHRRADSATTDDPGRRRRGGRPPALAPPCGPHRDASAASSRGWPCAAGRRPCCSPCPTLIRTVPMPDVALGHGGGRGRPRRRRWRSSSASITASPRRPRPRSACSGSTPTGWPPCARTRRHRSGAWPASPSPPRPDRSRTCRPAAGPIVEIAAVDHADRDLRLFAT